MRVQDKTISWWKGWLALGVAFASIELIANAFFGRFPIYLYQGGSPVLAIPIGALFEMLIWVILALAMGRVLELARRIFKGADPWHIGARVAAALCLETYIIRSLSAVYMRNGLFRFHAPPNFHDTPVIIGIIIVAVMVGVLTARRRRSANYHILKWDNLRLSIFVSTLAAVYVIVYNRWMSTTTLPLPGISGWVIGVIVAAIILSFLCRKRGISPVRLSGLLAFSTLFAVIVLTGYYSWPVPLREPNIIVSLWDTARASSMSLYGYQEITTPGLESLVSRAVVFDNAYTPSNYTYPSHVSFFTGKTYREHNYHIGDGDEVRKYQNEYTLPERLRELGYYTVLLTENSWVLACDKGFDEVRYFPMLSAYFGPPPRTCEFGDFPPLRKYAGPFLGRMIVDAIAYYFDGYYTFTLERIQLRCFQELLIKSRRIGPLFVFWNWFTVHDRYHPYTDWPIGQEVDNYDFASEYALSIRYADERFMKLYNIIKNCEQLEKTILIVTSDHGEFLGEKNLWGHNKALFEPVLRVPLFITHPHLKGRRVTAPVSLTSFWPLVEYLSRGWEALNAEKSECEFFGDQKVIAEHGFLPEKYSRIYQWSYSVIDDDVQYVHDPLIKTYGSAWSERETELLLDNTSRFNGEGGLISPGQSRALDLKKYYRDYLERIKDEKGRILPPGAKDARERKLKSLGYL